MKGTGADMEEHTRISAGALVAAVFAALPACLLMGGCAGATPGTTMALGAVSYEDAFATSKEVVARRFSIASADAQRGEIVCRPKAVAARGERVLGGSPARQVAMLHLRRQDGGVAARMSVELQREGSPVHSTVPTYERNYNEVPNETPAQGTAATTAEQNATWQTQGYDHALERQILDEISKSLSPRGP
jgi:hypothetical protein